MDAQVVQLLEAEGLDQLYPPQQDAVNAGVLDGKNLVLASPTASGKTLVAEICILKHVLERNGKAIYLAPLRALASEKFKEFQKYSQIKKPSGERLRVGISTGDYDSSDPWLGRYDVIISTNEKCLGEDEEIAVISEREVDIVRISDFFSIVSAQGHNISNGSMTNAIPKEPVYTISLDRATWEPQISQIECVSKISNNSDSLHTLTLDSGREVALTADHSLFTVEDGELRKVRASKAEGKPIVCLRDVSKLFKEKLARLTEAPLAYLHVLHNSTEPAPSNVYSLQTSHGNFFTASGILVSNCDSLLRHRAPWMNELSLVVADEVHLLTEHERGPTLEVVLTRLTEINPNIQVLALSATVRNAEEVGEWLHAGSVTTDWRPVPLKEGIYLDGQLQFRDGSSRLIPSGTKTPVLDIALDVVGIGGQALIFTETRRSAVEMGRKAAVAVKPRLSKIEERSLNTIAERVLSSGEKTRLGEALAEQVASGAAFHHAGLPGPHRGIVETSFREGRIKILAATPTLCLPAGEEIFGNPAPIPIEKLSTSDKVLTHGNVFENVVTPTSREYDGPLVKVTPWFQLPMRMTPEHLVLKARRVRHSLHKRLVNRHWWTYSKPEWTKATNLRAGDLVLFPRIKEEQDTLRIDLPKQGPLTNQTGRVGEHWSRLKVDHLKLTPETLEILGLYIAEGYTGKNGQVMFALNTKETDITLQVTSWFKEIGLSFRIIDRDRHRRVVRACSKQLAELLVDLCGSSALEKKIPHELISLPNTRLTHIVRGMWRGDGDIARAGPRIARYSTVSRCLAKQLFAVIVKLGYMPCLRVTKRAGSVSTGLLITHRHDLYTISVSGRQLTQFLRQVLRVRPRTFNGNREFNRGYLDSNYYYMPIRNIRQEQYHGTVHNLEVDGHSSYVGSFVVHNSAGVNLPARTVVISSYERFESGHGRYPISVLEYKQFCLPGGTGVTLHDGSLVPIESLVEHQKRTRVLSISNPHGIVDRPITGHFERYADELVDISTDIGRTLTATPEHPILSMGSDGRSVWTPICRLKPGDRVAYSSSQVQTEDQPDLLPRDLSVYKGELDAPSYRWVKVTKVDRTTLSNPIKVYNLSVRDTETYLASNFIVHNCGRAGRPKYDKYGESVLIARSQDEADWLMENYVLAQPEKLWSKLAVETILRPHVLSTVAAGYAKTEEGLYAFFERTFYAHQYGPRMIKSKIGEVLKFLANQEMVEVEGRDLAATKFGKRVSELYIDPMSAVILRDGLYNRAKKMTDFSLLHLISKTPDIAPRPRPRGSEVDKLGVMAASHSDEFMGEVPKQFEDPIAYDEFLSQLKATLVLTDWISENSEDQILETRKVEPGDLLRLVQGSEWLVFAAQELGRLFGHRDLLAPMEMLRVRVSKGVKSELVKLVGLEGVGRVRARMLYNAGLKTIDDIKERSLTELTSIPSIGQSLAKRIKEQAGGLIKAEEWEKAKSVKSASVEQQQVVLTDYEDSE